MIYYSLIFPTQVGEIKEKEFLSLMSEECQTAD